MTRDERRDDVSDSTRRAEDHEARRAHRADRPATAEEEDALDDEPVDDNVRQHYQEMTERGVEEKGEGRIP